ncbi:hypothetical protein AVEN_51985-1 [Araneus ventricosus]|uniref:Uncharacterized protein n=1 Tax=Araneus ventricosus TaxID=182803 RepID=A0A4Y2CGC3_ARAVE|nr:hypothetical protein AVEN_51985-1 [Araneus ventricosus]
MLASGKAGLATKDLPSFFGNPSTSELLKIHLSEDDDALQMSCEQPATPLTGVDNSSLMVPLVSWNCRGIRTKLVDIKALKFFPPCLRCSSRNILEAKCSLEITWL